MRVIVDYPPEPEISSPSRIRGVSPPRTFGFRIGIVGWALIQIERLQTASLKLRQFSLWD